MLRPLTRFVQRSIPQCIRSSRFQSIAKSSVPPSTRSVSLPRVYHSPVVLRYSSSMSSVDEKTRAQHIVPLDVPVCQLTVKDAFNLLGNREQRYAHHMSQATWYGSLIVLLQTSPESPYIFEILMKSLKNASSDEFSSRCKSAGISDNDVKGFFVYAASFFSNMGNYRSFGDTKIIPGIDAAVFRSCLEHGGVYASDADKENVLKTFDSLVADRMYNLSPRFRQLGLGADAGISTYYSANCDKGDAAFVQVFMDKLDLSPYNTRVFKSVSEDGKTVYDLRLASAWQSSTAEGEGDDVGAHLGTHEIDGRIINISRGDYSPLMAGCCDHLTRAVEFAANAEQAEMLRLYIQSFQTGSVKKHIDGSSVWIKDRGPMVESYIGFIESYRDPHGVRGEFEGFVACVNKEMSAKFQTLVDRATQYLPMLPWPTSFEKDTFLRPDFTSLEVITFGGSGIPAGINIPNYDSVRQNVGFKNVSLGNVLAAPLPSERISFLVDADQDLYRAWRSKSFEVQVGLHELLGHGSGKLFNKNADGSFNYDTTTVTNPLDNEPIRSWYGPGETYDSRFAAMGSTYEECRAECVGIYLCLEDDVLGVFGYSTPEERQHIKYVNWLNMVRAGLMGLQFYQAEAKQWGQAHMQARYVILRVLLEAGDGLVQIEEIASDAEDGRPNLLIKLDAEKLDSVGKPAIGKFLQKLQVYKATADVHAARTMYDGYSEVSEKFLQLREIVIERRRPRPMFVQMGTAVNGDTVDVCEYPATVEGLSQSFAERFSAADALAVRDLADAEAFAHAY